MIFYHLLQNILQWCQCGFTVSVAEFERRSYTGHLRQAQAHLFGHETPEPAQAQIVPIGFGNLMLERVETRHFQHIVRNAKRDLLKAGEAPSPTIAVIASRVENRSLECAVAVVTALVGLDN